MTQTIDTASTLTLTCCVTSQQVEAKPTRTGAPRLPKGWRRIASRVYSPEGWREKYTLSAVIVPIYPCSEDRSVPGRTAAWKLLNQQLQESWARSTELANWANQRLLSHDLTRDPETGKLPPMPSTYLYGERDFVGWSNNANAVLRTVEQTYRANRKELLYFGRRRLPDVRYPYPWPVPAANWTIQQIEQDIVVSLPLYGGRVQLGCKLGRKYARQRARLLQLINGQAVQGEAAIYRRGSDAVLKIVGYFPRSQRKEASGSLIVRTDTTSFIVALNERDERIFIVNGDEFRRTIAKHRAWQQRFREDQKFEKRQPHKVRKSRLRPMQEGAEKFRNRQANFVDQTVAQLVNHAVRRGLAVIEYDDSCREFFGENFPYHVFSLTLRQVAEREGLEFRERSNTGEASVTARIDKQSEEG